MYRILFIDGPKVPELATYITDIWLFPIFCCLSVAVNMCFLHSHRYIYMTHPQKCHRLKDINIYLWDIVSFPLKMQFDFTFLLTVLVFLPNLCQPWSVFLFVRLHSLWAVLFLLWITHLYPLPILLLGSLSVVFRNCLLKTPLYFYTYSQRTPLYVNTMQIVVIQAEVEKVSIETRWFLLDIFILMWLLYFESAV